jgi:16S rRNA pseudouridine516 synthase
VHEKRVTVDGVPVAKHDVKVLPSADGGVLVDDEPLDHPEGLAVVLHKPKGVVCSHDEREGPNVYDLLPEKWRNRNPAVEAVGRLDKDTTGLLLFTDDGTLSHRLTSPKKKTPVWKTYELTVDRAIPSEAVEAFATGTLVLDGETDPCRPAVLTISPVDRKVATLRLTEGKFHQVKRMMLSVGCEVKTLHRSRFGGVGLGEMREGDAAVVDKQELELKLFEECRGKEGDPDSRGEG